MIQIVTLCTKMDIDEDNECMMRYCHAVNGPPPRPLAAAIFGPPLQYTVPPVKLANELTCTSSNDTDHEETEVQLRHC